MRRVLVASGNFKKSYAVFRSLRKGGLDIAAVFYADQGRRKLPAPNFYSRLLEKRYLVPHPLRDERGYLLGVIDAARDFRADVVVPVGYIDFLCLSKHKRVVEELAAPVAAPDYEKLARSSDKELMSALAAKVGVKVPRFISFRNWSGRLGDAEALVSSSLKPPYVVKGLGDASSPTIHLDPRDAARDAVARRGMVQEFIPGCGFGYFALAVQGKPLLEFMHRRIVEAGPLGGASLMAGYFEDVELLKLGRRIVGALKWDGVIMVEFRRDYETGDYYFMEANPKFWGSLDLAVECLINFPLALARATAGLDPRLTIKRVRSLTFAWVAYTAYRHLFTEPYFLPSFIARTIRRRARTDIWLTDPAVTLAVLQLSFRRRSPAISNLRFPRGALRRLVEWLNSRRPVLSLDLDGTLVSLSVNWREVYREAVGRGLVRKGCGLLASLYRLRSQGRRDEASELHSLLEEYEMLAAQRVHRDRALVGALKKLKTASPALKLCLVTKQSSKVASTVLRRLGIHGFFDKVITREFSLLREEQLRAARELGADVLHVGDQVVDVVAAVRVGACPVLITGDLRLARGVASLGVLYTSSVKSLLETLYRLVSLRTREGG